MGDSDEDYNHNNNGNSNNNNNNNNNSASSYKNNINKNKNRDKFHRERDDFNQNNSNSYNKNSNDRRGDWSDRNRGGGRGMSNMGGYNPGGGYNRMQNSDYARKYTNQSSPGHYDSSPPPAHKRNKKEWDASPSVGGMEQTGYGYHNSNFGSKMASGGQMDYGKANQSEPEYPTQPPFLSFKLFLQQQSDDISDEEAIRRYNEYKIDFKKTQIHKFFFEHKEEEW